MWIIKLGGRIIGHVTSTTSVLEPRIAVTIEPCLLAYGVKVYLGEDVRTPIAYGYRVVGPSVDTVATAIKRCIAHVLHRKVEVTEEKIYVVESKKKSEGEHNESEEIILEEG